MRNIWLFWISLIIVSSKGFQFQIHVSQSPAPRQVNPRSSRLLLRSRRNWFTNILSGKRMKRPQETDYLLDAEESIDENIFRPKEGSIGETAVMMESFRKAQNVAKRTELMTQELRKTKIDGISSNGKVRVYFDGQQNPLGIDIDENFLDGIISSKDLSNSITEAMQDAHDKSRNQMKDKMQSLYSDIGLPTM